MRRSLFIVTILFSLGVGFSFGVWVYHYQKPPYKQVRAIHRRIFQKPVYLDYSAIAEDYWGENVERMIEIRDPGDVESKRRELIKWVWKGAGFPASSSPSVERSIQDARYTDMDNLQSIDRYVLLMDYGINSVIYHFLPTNGGEKLVIYHQGHVGDFVAGKETIRSFLEGGFSVLAFAMPLLGMNSQPIVDLGHVGKVRLTSHDFFKFFESDTTASMRFFLDPIAVSLNYVEEHYDYDAIHMVGHSGGGATTILYAALDPRITNSYPVNTVCMPIFLRSKGTPGDYEKSVPGFFQIANWLELYVMGSFGEGRRQLQIWNVHDPDGRGATRSHAYREKVIDVVQELGSGSFDIYLDPTNFKHTISRLVDATMLEDITKSQ